MHPLVIETLAQQRLRTLRPGQLPDLPEHLRDDVWAAWAIQYRGPHPISGWLRRVFSTCRRPQLQASSLRRVRAAAPTVPAARPAVIGCRP